MSAHKELVAVRHRLGFCEDRIKEAEEAITNLQTELRRLEKTAKDIELTHDFQLLQMDAVIRHVRLAEQ